MRTWVKATLGVVGVVAVLFGILAGTSAYYVMRNLDTRSASEAEAAGEFEAIKTRFGTRPPLIEIGDPQKAEVKINRPAEPSRTPVSTVHVLTWEAEERQVFRTAVPVWLMRFSSANVLSQLGLAPERFRLTAQDLERYGPGVVVDFSRPGENRVLVWLD
jgi:hypothetical protein